MKNDSLVAVEKDRRSMWYFTAFASRHAFIAWRKPVSALVVIDRRPNLFNDWSFIKVRQYVVASAK